MQAIEHISNEYDHVFPLGKCYLLSVLSSPFLTDNLPSEISSNFSTGILSRFMVHEHSSFLFFGLSWSVSPAYWTASSAHRLQHMVLPASLQAGQERTSWWQCLLVHGWYSSHGAEQWKHAAGRVYMKDDINNASTHTYYKSKLK